MSYQAARSISLVCDPGQDLPAKRFVIPSATGIVLAASADDAVGVSLELYDDSEFTAGNVSDTIAVALLDGAVLEIEAGAAIAAGVRVIAAADGSGKAITAVGATARTLGWSLEAAGADAEIIRILAVKGAGEFVA